MSNARHLESETSPLQRAAFLSKLQMLSESRSI